MSERTYYPRKAKTKFNEELPLLLQMSDIHLDDPYEEEKRFIQAKQVEQDPYNEEWMDSEGEGDEEYDEGDDDTEQMDNVEMISEPE